MRTKLWTEEEISKKLAEIHSRVPENLKKNVVRNIAVSPTVEKVMREAVLTESIPLKKREQIQALLDSGDFSKVKPQENARIAKMIDNFIGREINKAIKNGSLPTKSELKKMPHYQKFFNTKENE